MLLQIDGGPVQEVRQAVSLMSLYPAGPTVRTAGTDSRYAQVRWDPGLYRTIAPGLSRLPRIDPALTFEDPLLGQPLRTLIEEIGGCATDRLLAHSIVAAVALRGPHRQRRCRKTPRTCRSNGCAASWTTSRQI